MMCCANQPFTNIIFVKPGRVNFNIKVIDPQGEKFDPHLHQAMSVVDSDLPPNTVVHVMQKGYVLNDRVIRPALVMVSKTKET